MYNLLGTLTPITGLDATITGEKVEGNLNAKSIELGLTPDISIGTVETGEEAEVIITGTKLNPILNFKLQKGEKGDTGDTGEIGPKGETGDVGPKGDTGPIGETGPKGDTGAKGDIGPKGDVGPKGEKGETGPKGEIGPKGETGEIGPKGETGADGYTPIKGTDYFTEEEKASFVSEIVDDANSGFNSNFDLKTTEFNTIAENKIAELTAINNKNEELISSELEDNLISGTSINVDDSVEYKASISLKGNHLQDGTPTPDVPVEIQTIKDNINITKCNKNLFDKNNINATHFYNDTTNGVIKSNTSAQGFYIKIPKNCKISVQRKLEGNNSDLILSTFSSIPTTNSSCINVIKVTGNKVATITNINDTYLHVYYLWGTDTTIIQNMLDSFEIELGDNVGSEIIEHQEETYTIPVQQEMLDGDYFTDTEEVHTWIKDSFNTFSSANVTLQDSSFANYNRFLIRNNTNLKTTNNYASVLSNYFQYSSDRWNNNPTKICIFNWENSGLYALLLPKTYDTIEKVCTLLNGLTDLKIYTKRLNPLKLSLTDTQKSVLAELKNNSTYKDVTNVYSTDAVSPVFTLDYKQSNRIRIKKLENAITALQVASVALNGEEDLDV